MSGHKACALDKKVDTRLHVIRTQTFRKVNESEQTNV